MLNINDASDKELLMALLGRNIAQVHFDVNQIIFKDEQAFYAKEGISKKEYMEGSIEHLENDIDENIRSKILEVAEQAYKKLCEEEFDS